MTPQNILLTNDSLLYAGGEFFVFSLAKALMERGHNVFVSCNPGTLLEEKCRTGSVTVLPLSFPKKGRLVSSVLRLKKIIEEKKISILHSNTNYDRTAGAIAARLSGAAHVASVHSFHSLQHNLTHWMRNRIAIDRLIVDGVCVRELLVRQDGIRKPKISVIHLGIDPDRIKTDSGLRQKVRDEFHLDRDQIVIGNVGRLVPFKGQAYLLEAAGNILKTRPDVTLMVVGDGELRESLETNADNLGIRNQVIFTGFRDDLTAVYSAFDVYVHASVEHGGETFPFAVLQALAHALPAIVTRVGDVPAMVEEGRNGFVVGDRNSAALANKLAFVIDRKEIRKQFGLRSREILLDRFTLTHMVDRVESVYEQVLRERKNAVSG